MNLDFDLNILLEKLFDIVPIAISGIFAYIIGKKKGEAELKQVQADALKTMQEVYDSFTSDTKSKYEELKDDVKALHEETVALKLENKKYKEQAAQLDLTIVKLHIAIEECTKRLANG